ncbi:hypothetical protein [Pantoea agglomerans]|uniref:hypothetical protein n=1 Tax=Enterobacter agglomerans TaxID=549 RepID=UPI003C7EA557
MSINREQVDITVLNEATSLLKPNQDVTPVNVNNCQTYGEPMSKTPGTMSFDCGGDCLCCMTFHGDPDAIEIVEKLTGEKVNVWGSSYRSSKVEGL